MIMSSRDGRGLFVIIVGCKIVGLMICEAFTRKKTPDKHEDAIHVLHVYIAAAPLTTIMG